MRSSRLFALAALVVAALVTDAPAIAGSATTNLGVSANVIAKCTIAAKSTVAFGDYDPSNATATDGTGALTVTCSKGASTTIALDLGSGGGGSARKMAGPGSATLAYELYTDAARTAVWGTATGSTFAYTGTGFGAPTDVTVYGRIAAKQDVPVGGYSDTVVATINF